MEKRKVTAVVLAAGQGRRMNLPVAKQFYQLKGKPVIYYSLKAFEDSCVDDIVLVVGSEQINYCRENIVKEYHLHKVSKVIEGGSERYDSVYRALTYMDGTDYVLIHDGARPFISTELIERVVQEVTTSGACIVAVPVKDTIKIVDGDGMIVDTPSRDALWSAQTPQAFPYSSIRKAYDILYEKEGVKKVPVTDDAMVYETYMKQRIKVVPGDYTNLKITTREDILLAEMILNRKKET